MTSKEKMSSDSSGENSVDIERLWHIWNMNGPDLSLSCEICALLKDNNCHYELDVFLRNLPTEDKYLKDETLNRARIYAAFWKKDFEAVYSLIEENTYSNGEDLIDVWDLSHYYEEEIKKKKPLTPLARFRIRQRNLPPKSILPSGKRKTTTLPQDSKQLLQTWLNENTHYPYPSREHKEMLAENTGLSIFQVSTWFANARRKLYHNLRNESRKKRQTKSPQKNRQKRGRKAYSECSLKTEPELECDLSADHPRGIRWYPSNQLSPQFSCYSATNTALPTLMDRVNHCMTMPYNCYAAAGEDWISQYSEDLNMASPCMVPKETSASAHSMRYSNTDYFHPGYDLEELNHQESTNDDAAKILIDLSNTFLK